MKLNKMPDNFIRDTILFVIAILIALIVYAIDVSLPLSVAIGCVYSLVILYSWILSNKNVTIYLGVFCSVLIIIALIKNADSLTKGGIEGINSFISLIVVWISVALVSATKMGFSGLEKSLESLEEKVRLRTQELTKSRKELEVNEKIYRYLYEKSGEMHASVDLESNLIVRCNETLCKNLGYTKEELLLKPVQLLHTPKSKLALKTVIDTYKSKGVVSNAKLTLKGKKSKQISVILNITSAKNTQGQITESRFSWTDISVLELIDKERAENAKKLVLKNKELEQFAFIASHDLQEPLRTVSSFSGLLTNKYHDKLDQTGKDSLGFIADATTRMQDLVKGLLDYSRIGKNIEIADLSVPDIIEGLKIDLSLRIEETLTVIETHNLPLNIKGYKLEMRQLFYNLIVNAMKFCAKGVNPKILITATEKNEFVEFCVADNGIGVSKEHQKKIFEIFKRLHIHEEYEGTGIGLAHCQKIVELHGGKIWVESELGQGSKFYFTISKKNKTLL